MLHPEQKPQKKVRWCKFELSWIKALILGHEASKKLISMKISNKSAFCRHGVIPGIIKVDYNTYMAACSHRRNLSCFTMMQHKYCTSSFLWSLSGWQWHVSQGPIYSNYKRVHPQKCTHTSIFCQLPLSASASNPFIWQHHEWPGGDVYPHTHSQSKTPPSLHPSNPKHLRCLISPIHPSV